jgi:chromate transporter
MAFLVGLLGQGILPAVAVSPPAEVGRPPTVPLATPLPDWKRSVRVFLICMVLWWMPVGLAAVWLGTEHVLVREGVFFSGASVMTFGGAYAVLPYVAQQAVEQFHWVSRSEMMAGMALAETTPGPLIIVLQFIGFLGAWHQPGFLSPGMSGILGAGMTSWTTFFPSFLWIFLGAPWVERLQGLKQWERWVGVVSAGVVGMILHLAWGLGVSALGTADGRLDGPALTILVVAFGLMRWGQWPSGAVILLSGVLGILRSKLGL